MSDIVYGPFLVPIVAIVGAFTYSIVKAVTRARVRELEVRERIAMIERGLVPPPERDPQAFDRAMNTVDRVRERRDWDDAWRQRSPARYRSGGITMIGVGFGLMLLIDFAGGEPNVALGVGGFLVIMGMAFVINSWLERRPGIHYYPPPPYPPMSYPPQQFQPPQQSSAPPPPPYRGNEPPRSS